MKLLAIHEASKTYLVSASDAARLNLPVIIQRVAEPEPDQVPVYVEKLSQLTLQEQKLRRMALEVRRRKGCKPDNGLDLIAVKVALRSGLTVSDLKLKSREQELVDARYRAFFGMKLAKPNRAFGAIGRFFGLDHTTVLYGYRQHEKRLLKERCV